MVCPITYGGHNNGAIERDVQVTTECRPLTGSDIGL